MSGRTQAVVFGPVIAMLPVHITLLVLAARNMPAHGPWRPGDPWTTWNLAGPGLLLFVFGYAVRRLNEDGEGRAGWLARLTMGAAAADLVATVIVFVVTHR